MQYRRRQLILSCLCGAIFVAATAKVTSADTPSTQPRVKFAAVKGTARVIEVTDPAGEPYRALFGSFYEHVAKGEADEAKALFGGSDAERRFIATFAEASAATKELSDAAIAYYDGQVGADMIRSSLDLSRSVILKKAGLSSYDPVIVAQHPEGGLAVSSPPMYYLYDSLDAVQDPDGSILIVSLFDHDDAKAEAATGRLKKAAAAAKQLIKTLEEQENLPLARFRAAAETIYVNAFTDGASAVGE